ncbi:unnamed protein product [Zymoseptoria tritici ST99CH_3D1]|nr:unnamed protein product [Zymoseptoria tritici ST99CH_3D1]
MDSLHLTLTPSICTGVQIHQQTFADVTSTPSHLVHRCSSAVKVKLATAFEAQLNELLGNIKTTTEEQRNAVETLEKDQQDKRKALMAEAVALYGQWHESRLTIGQIYERTKNDHKSEKMLHSLFEIDKHRKSYLNTLRTQWQMTLLDLAGMFNNCLETGEFLKILAETSKELPLEKRDDVIRHTLECKKIRISKGRHDRKLKEWSSKDVEKAVEKVQNKHTSQSEDNGAHDQGTDFQSEDDVSEEQNARVHSERDEAGDEGAASRSEDNVPEEEQRTDVPSERDEAADRGTEDGGAKHKEAAVSAGDVAFSTGAPPRITPTHPQLPSSSTETPVGYSRSRSPEQGRAVAGPISDRETPPVFDSDGPWNGHSPTLVEATGSAKRGRDDNPEDPQPENTMKKLKPSPAKVSGSQTPSSDPHFVLEHLRPEQWLSTTGVDELLKLFAPPHVHIVDSGYVGRLLSSDKEYKPRRNSFAKSRLLVVPIYDKPYHWCLGIVDRQRREVEFYDPLARTPDRRSTNWSAKLLVFCKTLPGYQDVGPIEWTLAAAQQDRPIQDDFINCGIFIILHAIRRMHATTQLQLPHLFTARHAFSLCYIAIQPDVNELKLAEEFTTKLDISLPVPDGATVIPGIQVMQAAADLAKRYEAASPEWQHRLSMCTELVDALRETLSYFEEKARKIGEIKERMHAALQLDKEYGLDVLTCQLHEGQSDRTVEKLKKVVQSLTALKKAIKQENADIAKAMSVWGRGAM